MKKILFFLAMGFLAGCGSSGDGDVPETNQITPSSANLKGTWYAPATACSYSKKTVRLNIGDSTISKDQYAASLSYYDDTYYLQFLYDINIEERSVVTNTTTFNYSANGNMPSGGAGDISLFSTMELTGDSLLLIGGCGINGLYLMKDTAIVLNLSLDSYEQETTVIRNAHYQAFEDAWISAYVDLLDRGLSRSTIGCTTWAGMFETYLKYMTQDVYGALLKHAILDLPDKWYIPIYDKLKSLDVQAAPYPYISCSSDPDVELQYDFLYQ